MLSHFLSSITVDLGTWENTTLEDDQHMQFLKWTSTLELIDHAYKFAYTKYTELANAYACCIHVSRTAQVVIVNI